MEIISDEIILSSPADDCIKLVEKHYYKDAYKLYCIYKDLWFDYDLCKNCKYNKLRR